jgi:signal transduction histidine kinase
MGNPMARSRSNQKPTFLWQAVLILLPVIVLAALGLFSLRQDKRLVEQEARERAQQIADDLGERIEKDVTEYEVPQPADAFGMETVDAGSGLVSFQISSQGDLLYPPPYELAPVPQPLATSELSDQQKEIWQAARAAEFGDNEADSAINACHRFIASGPPAKFLALARFDYGVLLLQRGHLSEGAEQLTAATQAPFDVKLESGLPLQPVAQLKLIEAALTDVTVLTNLPSEPVSDLCSNAVFHPSLITPTLLDAAGKLEIKLTGSSREADKWRTIWREHESARNLYMAASRKLNPATDAVMKLEEPVASLRSKTMLRGAPDPSSARQRLFWIAHGADEWLTTTVRQKPEALWVVCRPERSVRESVERLIRSERGLPEYFGVNVELAGRPITPATNPRVQWKPDHGNAGRVENELEDPAKFPPGALATTRKTWRGTDQLKVSVYLTNRAMLFSRQESRSLLFGLLIAASALAAVAGLVGAWRAFERQLQLAELKTNFVSSVSHELRAPIASVRLLAESLDRGKISGAQKQTEYFRLIVQECSRLTSLIENVLDFSRIDQGRKQYEFEPTDIVALVEQTVRLMEPGAVERQVSVVFAAPGESLTGDVDARAIQQALVNLLDNAIKHSPAGATVTVGLESRLNLQSSNINLFVEDHGDGIPPEDHDRIFEPFYRRGAELRRETQGVGIGLTIVKHIVEGHGGKVTVRSAPGEGSRFTIELPVNRK